MKTPLKKKRFRCWLVNDLDPFRCAQVSRSSEYSKFLGTIFLPKNAVLIINVKFIMRLNGKIGASGGKTVLIATHHPLFLFLPTQFFFPIKQELLEIR